MLVNQYTFSVHFKVWSQVSKTLLNVLMIRPPFVSSLIFFLFFQQLDYGHPVPRTSYFMMVGSNSWEQFSTSLPLFWYTSTRFQSAIVLFYVISNTWTRADVWTFLPPKYIVFTTKQNPFFLLVSHNIEGMGFSIWRILSVSIEFYLPPLHFQKDGHCCVYCWWFPSPCNQKCWCLVFLVL